MKRTAYILLIISLAFTSCRKTYEEGPKISFRHVANRISQVWMLDKVFIDGVDKTSEYMNIDGRYNIWDFEGQGKKDWDGTIEFKSDQSNFIHIAGGDLSASLDYIAIHGRSSLSQYNSSLTDTSFHYGPIGSRQLYGSTGYTYVEWKIKKLTKKEFTLEVIYENKQYRVELSL